MSGQGHYRGSPYRRRTRRPAAARVATSADWLALLKLATTCAEEASGGTGESDEARMRLATLANRINAASPDLFEREAGAATSDVARAFIRVGGSFANRVTPDDTRRDLADMVLDMAVFLDRRIHAMATEAFRAAHAGRPEVWR